MEKNDHSFNPTTATVLIGHFVHQDVFAWPRLAPNPTRKPTSRQEIRTGQSLSSDWPIYLFNQTYIWTAHSQ